MKKFSLELPKYRLEFNAKLVRRRKPLMEEPLLPTATIIKKKYRSGTFVGKVARHVSEHRSARKVLAANMAAFVIVGTFLPGSQIQAQNIDSQIQTDDTIIQTQNTLKTEKSIQYPLEKVRTNQTFGLFHPGIDLGAEVGDIIKPIKKGEVVEAGYSTDGYGNTVLIDHGQGLTSRYAHLSKIETKVGDLVTTEIEIGKVGITGRTTGPHLHLEIRQNGMPLNPLYVLPR
jgi:murein DD-endopeptidase MepM/ murein hydrolase activator NlpD